MIRLMAELVSFLSWMPQDIRLHYQSSAKNFFSKLHDTHLIWATTYPMSRGYFCTINTHTNSNDKKVLSYFHSTAQHSTDRQTTTCNALLTTTCTVQLASYCLISSCKLTMQGIIYQEDLHANRVTELRQEVGSRAVCMLVCKLVWVA